jgi:hypothetical protein
MEIRLPKNVYSSLGYRTIVRDKMREAGREWDADSFFLDAFTCDRIAEGENHLEYCVRLAKEKYDVITIWE